MGGLLIGESSPQMGLPEAVWRFNEVWGPGRVEHGAAPSLTSTIGKTWIKRYSMNKAYLQASHELCARGTMPKLPSSQSLRPRRQAVRTKTTATIFAGCCDEYRFAATFIMFKSLVLGLPDWILVC